MGWDSRGRCKYGGHARSSSRTTSWGCAPRWTPRAGTKELALLSKALDTLREGKFDVLADMVAARLIAVDTATRQGWGMARHLEIYDAEDGGTAPACTYPAGRSKARKADRASRRERFVEPNADMGQRLDARTSRKRKEQRCESQGKEASGKEKEAEAEDGRIGATRTEKTSPM